MAILVVGLSSSWSCVVAGSVPPSQYQKQKAWQDTHRLVLRNAGQKHLIVQLGQLSRHLIQCLGVPQSGKGVVRHNKDCMGKATESVDVVIAVA